MTDEFPPCSKLFVSIGTNFTEKEVRDAFSVFGEIEKLFIPKDNHGTGMRGFVFIKYRTTLSAANALEAMNGREFGADQYKLAVKVAGARKEEHDGNVDIIPQRIIVSMPDVTATDQISQIFSEYGNILDVTQTKSDPKKYVIKFETFKQAATCFENCKKYYAKFVLPKKKEKMFDMGEMGGGMMPPHPAYGGGSPGFAANFNTANTRLRVVFNTVLSKGHLQRIFNIIPGFIDIECVDMGPSSGVAIVTYDNGQSAGHAVDRIDGLEYPLGSTLKVEPAPSQHDPKVSTLLNTIKEATSALKGSGFNISVNGLPDVPSGFGMGPGPLGNTGMGPGSMGYGPPGQMGQRFSGVSRAVQARSTARLPDPQPLLHTSTEVAQRLFFVFKNVYETPPQAVVNDLFGRFGNLVNVHCIKGKKCGYARFASKENAERCLKVLDGSGFAEGVLKVELAEPELYQKDYSKKRRMDE